VIAKGDDGYHCPTDRLSCARRNHSFRARCTDFVAGLAGRLDQLLDLVRRQVLALAQVGIDRPERHCPVLVCWRMRLTHDFRSINPVKSQLNCFGAEIFGVIGACPQRWSSVQRR